MRNPESIEVTRTNRILQTPPPTEYFGMHQRQKCNDCCETKQAHVACENTKKNAIYILIITVVVLIGLLSFAGFLLFERKRSVLAVDKDKIDRILKSEQRFWYDDAFNDLKKSIEFEPNEGQAKNIIVFVGDGMGNNNISFFTSVSLIFR